MAKVLVVDDAETIQQLTRHCLEKEGHTVIIASNGMEGLMSARQDRPDVIVLDAIMPDLDGFETLKFLKKEADTRDIPVIMLTSRVSPEDIDAGKELGADAYLTKPFVASALLRHIDKALKRKSTGA